MADLSPLQRALLARRLQSSGSAPAITPRVDPLTSPLSYAQQRLWFLDRLDPGTARYAGVRAIRLRGARLNIAALASALDALAARHEALRTTFVSERGEPRQRIAPAGGAGFPLQVERCNVVPADRDAHEEQRAHAIAHAGFDLERGPLAHATLLVFADDDCTLLLALHHIITDRWSTAILERELARFYARAAAGDEPDDLPALALQPADIASWERARFDGGTLDHGLAYWTARLAGAPPPVGLPTVAPEAALLAHVPAGRFTARLPHALVTELRRFCLRERVTPFMVLLSAMQTLLARYSGSDDIAVGCPIAGRTLAQIEPLVGMFVNTIVLRVELGGDPTFDEVVARVRERALEAFDHQDVPFDKIVEVVRPERERDATPFFRVMFAFQNAPERALTLRDLRSEERDVHAGAAKFELTLMVEDGGADELTCVFEFDAARFDVETIRRSFGHYTNLLGAALADPSRRVASLPLVSTEEHAQLVNGWNETARPFPRDTGIDTLFARVVAAMPHATAIRYGEHSLTYAALDARASALALRLRRAGVDRETTAGVYLEASLDRIVALLAIVKAGGAYVPLDPLQPVERVATILRDSDARIVVTCGALADQLVAFDPATVVVDPACTDAAIDSEHSLTVPRAARGDDLFCVISTSGSTGRPKGVEITHRNVARLLCNTDYVEFRAGEVVVQGANFAFDAATFEIWGPLLHGGTVLLVERDVLLKPVTYARLLREHAVRIVFLTPVVFHAIARAVPDAFKTVRDVFVGGEALDPSAARLVLQSGAPPQRLINGYGPTEVTTWATMEVVRDLPAEARSVPIGRPIGNTTAYVVDALGSVVPVGVAGELVLGGPGVARGYRGLADLTAERFIEDRFSREPGARLYRTGDIVRRLSDGTLDYLGRADRQVKIRGFRIELGEIETTLGAHPAVAACAVVAHRGGPDSSTTELIAYIVRRPDSATTTDDELRAHLAQALPSYMLPAAYVPLDALPIGANGKLDRDALPTPAPERERASPCTGPRTALEVQLVAIWQELLPVRPIGVNDDFFALGGHSLLAVRMLERVERETGASLAMRVIFACPTIAELATAISDSGDVPAKRYTALRTEGSSPPFFLLHGHLSGGLYAVELARRAGDRPFYALHPHDSDGAREPLPPTIEAMADDHVRTILELAPHGPYYLGGFCNGARVAYEVALRLRDLGHVVPLLVIFTTPAPNRSSSLRDAVKALARLRGLDAKDELLAYLRWKDRLAGLRTPRTLAQWLAKRLRASTRADYDLGAIPEPSEADERWYAYVDRISRYVPRRAFDGRIAVVWGRDAERPPHDPTSGWSAWAEDVAVHVVPGHTTTSLTEHTDDVAEALRSEFARADARTLVLP